MKKLLKLVIAVCVLTSVLAFAFCADCEPYSDGFVKVFGTTISEQPDWAKNSEIFIEGRSVTISTLIVCDHEVTQGEYKAVMEHLPKYQAKTTGNAENNPVNKLSWYDALVYCNTLSIKEGLTPCYTINGSTDPKNWGTVPTKNDSTWNVVKCNFDANGYRLPTEAEWEYLARGKEGYEYSGSDNIDFVAWYAGNSKNRTCEVKTKKENAFSLYDMSGNVWEWCWDVSGSKRVLRGGSVDNKDTRTTVSYRSSCKPNTRSNDLGFRVVRKAE